MRVEFEPIAGFSAHARGFSTGKFGTYDLTLNVPYADKNEAFKAMDLDGNECFIVVYRKHYDLQGGMIDHGDVEEAEIVHPEPIEIDYNPNDPDDDTDAWDVVDGT